MTTTVRINRLVRQAIPKGKPAKIIWYSTGFSNSRILRVVTPAWRTLPRFQRISKLRQTLESNLSAQDLRQIFRISVLTAQEYKRLREMSSAREFSTFNRTNPDGGQRFDAA